ncbi:MAG TPA: MBL fold metallo-hydrolase [Chloroflexota bacterium]|nr:MBL fold metallo-hydrolase [Chloroflexota bacterium]
MQKIIMLGTGDPLTDERVQTSFALPLDDGETLLVDTTSGTALLHQLRAAGLALAGIRHLVMSHRHFDHAGGLAPLLTALVAVPEARLTVYAGYDTMSALRALLTLTIPGVESWLGARLQWRALAEGVPVEVGSVMVTPFAVDHGMECMGFRFAFGATDVVFSADTRPCPALVAHARDADLLIHEAYGVAAAAAEAHAYGHSTAADAGTAAREAGAGRLLLTHFRASRFADPSALSVEAEAAFGRSVELARDLDVITC